MNTAKWLRFVLAAMFSILAVACTAALEQFAPTPTATATASPIPPTRTPAATLTVGYEALLEEAWQAYNRKDFDEAQRIAEQVMDEDPGNGEAWALRGALFTTLRNFDAAILDWEQALVLRYEEPWILDYLSTLYLGRVSQSWDPEVIVESITGARENLTRLQELDPDYITRAGWSQYLTMEPDYGHDASHVDQAAFDEFIVAEDYFKQEEYEKAIKAYRKAIEIDPQFEIAHLYLGDTYYVLGDYESAIVEFERAVDINPQLVSGWGFLGDAWRNLGLGEHARRAYVAALLLDSEDEIAIGGLERINRVVGVWQDDYFTPYSFRLLYDPDLRIEPLIGSEFNEPSETQGAVSLSNESYLVVVTWQPWKSEKPFDFEESAQFARSVFADDPGVTYEGDPQDFVYGDAPTLVQLYTYDPGEEEDFRTGAYTVIACDARLFTVQFEFVDHPLESFVVNISPILESFRCELE